VNGKVSADLTTSVTQDVTVITGLEYANGSFTSINESFGNPTYDLLTLSTSCEASVFVRPQFELLIYGAAGPYVAVNAYVKLEADPSRDPWWEMKGGVRGEVGVELKILSHMVASYNDTLFDLWWLIAQAETAPPTHTPTPTLVPTPTSTPIPTVTPTRTPAPADTWIRPADNAVMVYVPAGEFEMGSADGSNDEKPEHRVYLDAFWIDKTEVTNAQYQRCVMAGACKESWYANDANSAGDAQPVVGVEHYMAEAYCEWVGARLPTEAEWEKAARGTDGRSYPWGNEEATCEYAVMKDGSGNGCGEDKTWPVGNKPLGASPYGALDMAGNVWEWVADWYDD